MTKEEIIEFLKARIKKHSAFINSTQSKEFKKIATMMKNEDEFLLQEIQNADLQTV